MRHFVFAVALLWAGTATAEELGIPLEAMTRILSSGRAPASYEEIVAQLGRPIRIYDRNGDGLTEAELDLADAVMAANLRTQMVMRFLPADLDDDHQVTREEFDTAVRVGERNMGGGSFEETDLNTDGVLSWEEMSQLRRPQRNSQKAELLTTSLEIDPTPETPFELADVTTLVDALFAAADRNGDKLIDATERKAVLESRKDQPSVGERFLQRGPDTVACTVDRPKPGDQVLMVGAYEGFAYASSYIGEPDEPTYAVNVTIEPGDKPLYVIAGAYHSIVWQFTGATERVRRVVLAGYLGQGTTGVPKESVAFVPRDACFRSAYKFEGFEGIVAKRSIERFAGRDDIGYAGAYDIYGVALPSLTLAEKPKSRERFEQPVVMVDPAAVFAATPVAPYAVLPGRAGIAQLLASGALEQIDAGSYRIAKPIPHYPADLGGAHSVNFLLGKGIPAPAGSAGHSCVISEDDGKAMSHAMLCRR